MSVTRHLVRLLADGSSRCTCHARFRTWDDGEAHAFDHRGSVEADKLTGAKR